MTRTTFVGRNAFWKELKRRVEQSKRPVCAAVAYLGKDGAELLPLDEGDTLVVDMSLRAARQGLTNPKEIRKLMKRGVKVYSRDNLHAKFFIIGDALIAGSANISHNSHDNLDEAAIITTSKTAFRQAREFFTKLCTEPVRPNYLDRCIKEYRPPQFKGMRGGGKRRRQAAKQEHAKLWFVGNIAFMDFSRTETEIVGRLEQEAAEHLRNPRRNCVSFIRFTDKPLWYERIQAGDWVVRCVLHGKQRHFVDPPGQAIAKRSYLLPGGRRRCVLMLEEPEDTEMVGWTRFQNRLRQISPDLNWRTQRTRPITDSDHADAIKRLWTADGKFSKRQWRNA